MVLYKQSRLNICGFFGGRGRTFRFLMVLANSIIPQNAKKQNAETCTYNNDLLK